MGRIVPGGEHRGRAPRPTGGHRDAAKLKPHIEPTRKVSPVDARTGAADPRNRGRRRVPVVVGSANRDERDRRPRRGEERGAGRGGAPVVGHLEHVDPGESARDQRGVHVVLGVTREQEAVPGCLTEQHNRRVVDSAAGAAGIQRHVAAARPEHAERHVAHVQHVALGKHRARRGVALPQGQVPGVPPGAAAAHPRLKHAANAVSLQRPDQPGDVILMRVRQHHDIQSPIPRRHHGVQFCQQARGVRAAIHEHAPPVAALHKDGVALADVEHDQSVRPTGHVGHRKPARSDRGCDDDQGQPLRPAKLAWATQ